jgi:uncharacterized coiled-coil DUF342 family protein
MSREVIIANLERYIKSLAFAQADAQVNPKWEDQLIDDALQEAKNLLERIKAGDDGAMQEASDLLDMR